jgi:hypothetical protein
VAKSGNAVALGATGEKSPCGFESRLPHPNRRGGRVEGYAIATRANRAATARAGAQHPAPSYVGRGDNPARTRSTRGLAVRCPR